MRSVCTPETVLVIGGSGNIAGLLIKRGIL
jgi:hypothetical protein